MSAVPRTTSKSGLAWSERDARSARVEDGHGRELPTNSRARNRSRSRRRKQYKAPSRHAAILQIVCAWTNIGAPRIGTDCESYS